MFLLESALREKARLAGAFPDVLRRFGAESLVAYGECLFAPVLPLGANGGGSQFVANPALSQLMADLQRSLATRLSMLYEALGESPIGQKIFGLQRIQHLTDERFGKAALREFAAELGARMLAARQQGDRLFTDCLDFFVQASASSAVSASTGSSVAADRRGISLARSAPSISRAISGCCLMNSRTLSRP